MRYLNTKSTDLFANFIHKLKSYCRNVYLNPLTLTTNSANICNNEPLYYGQFPHRDYLYLYICDLYNSACYFNMFIQYYMNIYMYLNSSLWTHCKSMYNHVLYIQYSLTAYYRYLHSFIDHCNSLYSLNEYCNYLHSYYDYCNYLYWFNALIPHTCVPIYEYLNFYNSFSNFSQQYVNCFCDKNNISINDSKTSQNNIKAVNKNSNTYSKKYNTNRKKTVTSHKNLVQTKQTSQYRKESPVSINHINAHQDNNRKLKILSLNVCGLKSKLPTRIH